MVTKGKEESCEVAGKSSGAPNGIRIRAAGLKGRCPRPLDDGGTLCRRGIIPWRGRDAPHSGASLAHDQVDVAVEHAQEHEHLVDRLAVVGRIEEPVELCR